MISCCEGMLQIISVYLFSYHPGDPRVFLKGTASEGIRRTVHGSLLVGFKQLST